MSDDLDDVHNAVPDPLSVARDVPSDLLTLELARRFWSKVRIGEPDECWLWTAASWKGRGHFRITGQTHQAQRIAWQLSYGPTAGLCVLHRCDVGACCNPNHLFLGTQLENVADREAKGRTSRGAAHSQTIATRGDSHWTRREPERLQVGSRCPFARLNEGQAAEIYGLRGEDMWAVAKRFGVSDRTVRRIWNLDIWVHVNGR